MSAEERERQRVERLRQQQINTRHPGDSKIRGYDWSKHATKAKQIKKKQQKPLLLDLYEVLPSRWRGLVIGLFLSLLVAVPMALLLSDIWRVMALLPILFGCIAGFVLGSMFTQKID